MEDGVKSYIDQGADAMGRIVTARKRRGRLGFGVSSYGELFEMDDATDDPTDAKSYVQSR